MPYATVEEAWGTNFNTQPRQAGPYAQVAGVGAPLPQPDATNLGYYSIDLIDSGMNAPNSASLPNPGGSVEWSPDMSKVPSGVPTASPIKSREYPRSRHATIKENFEDDDSDDEDDDKKDVLKKIREENHKLRKEIAHLRKQLEATGGAGDNAFDLIIFLVSGIIIIFLMDTFAKMVKRY
jgi:hypothetical protein